MSYTGNCDAPLAEAEPLDPIVTCQLCGEVIEPETCGSCEGQGGWRGSSEDDGYAWVECENCFSGLKYECWSDKCSAPTLRDHERDEDGNPRWGKRQ